MRLAVSFFSLALLSLNAQTIEVHPARALIDEPAAVRAGGCQPGEKVTIHGELIDGAGARWASEAEFIADAQGVVDTSKQAPVTGSYQEISALGLVWSMKPAGSGAGRYNPPRDLGAQTVEFRLIRNAAVVSTTHLEQIAVTDFVGQVSLHEGALRGLLFVPPGMGPHSAILVLGGSDGGIPARRAAWFASHGYATLALAYIRFDDLPRELAGIPLEYFSQALVWMARRPEIIPDHIAVSGTARGAEVALQLGSMYSAIKAVVAYVPPNVRFPACCGGSTFPAWTWQGKGLGFSRIGRNGRPQSDLRSEIAVENTHGPILLISGSDDTVWNSSAMTELLVRRLQLGHFAYEIDRLNYPHAGHIAGRPEIIPGLQNWARNPFSNRDTEMGGTPSGNAQSSLDAAPKVLQFLARALSGR
jgi:dienelactone hydrolase